MIEAERRKPEWVEGVWIKLCDDQEWCLPKPVVFRPATRFRRRITASPDANGAATLGMPLPIDSHPFFAIIARLLIAEDMEFLNALLNAGAVLLRHNYELTDDEIADLLCFEHDAEWNQTEANGEMWASIRDVATGAGPKPTPAT